MLIGQVPPLIRGRCADNRNIRDDGREKQPVLVLEIDFPDNRLFRRERIHRATAACRIGERIKAHFGDHAGPFRSRLPLHIEHDPRRHIIGGNVIARDHLPDLRRLPRGGAGGIGARNNLLDAARFGEMINAGNAVHVACGNRVYHR